MRLKIALPLLALYSITAVSAEYLPTGRYLEYTTKSDAPELILTIVRVNRMPRSVVTVGDAVAHILAGSGYRLAPLSSSDPMLPILFNAPLPDAHRVITPMTLCDALEMLGDEGWQVVYDPIHRLVSYQVRQDDQEPEVILIEEKTKKYKERRK